MKHSLKKSPCMFINAANKHDQLEPVAKSTRGNISASSHRILLKWLDFKFHLYTAAKVYNLSVSAFTGNQTHDPGTASALIYFLSWNELNSHNHIIYYISLLIGTALRPITCRPGTMRWRTTPILTHMSATRGALSAALDPCAPTTHKWVRKTNLLTVYKQLSQWD